MDSSEAMIEDVDIQTPVWFFRRAIGFEIKREQETVEAIFEWDPLVITFSGLQVRECCRRFLF